MNSPVTRQRIQSAAAVRVARARPMKTPTKLTTAAKTFNPTALAVLRPNFL